MGSTQDHLDGAEVVLTGTLVEIEDPPKRLLVSSTDPVTYTVSVDSVFQGDVGRDVAFTSARSGASCGLEGMDVGLQYLLFLHREGDGLSTSLCSGNVVASHANQAEVAAVTGPPRAPSPDATLGVPTSGIDDAGPPLAPPLWVLGAGVAGLVGLVGSLWARFLRG
jgi:hypothetical protein